MIFSPASSSSKKQKSSKKPRLSNIKSTGAAITFLGRVESTYEALLIFASVIGEALPQIKTRPSNSELAALVRSGSIFVYTETEGIRRWTDQRAWSPSRVVGDFLWYQELESKFDRKATGKQKRISHLTPKEKIRVEAKGTYVIKEDGLMKRTISILHGDCRMHLVSYSSQQDGNQNIAPISRVLQGVQIHPSILVQNKFKAFQPTASQSHLLDVAALDILAQTIPNILTPPNPLPRSIEDLPLAPLALPPTLAIQGQEYTTDDFLLCSSRLSLSKDAAIHPPSMFEDNEDDMRRLDMLCEGPFAAAFVGELSEIYQSFVEPSEPYREREDSGFDENA